MILDASLLNTQHYMILIKGKLSNPVKGVSIFINPSVRVWYDTKSIFKRSLTGLNAEFSFSDTSCLTKAEERSLPYNSCIPGGRIIGFIRLPRILVLFKIQSVSSRIRTLIAVSIFTTINITPWVPPLKRVSVK